MQHSLTALILGITLTSSFTANANTDTSVTQNAPPTKKIVIAHRGASGYLPEHTLPAKAMAYAQGVDYLEQDLVMTKDDKLIVLHDHYLDRVTDVADRFPDRARQDGRFYAIDFTLDEIRSLQFTEEFQVENGKRVQKFAGRFPMFKSNFHIHTFAEEIEFIQGLNHSTGKRVGLYPEIKAPWFHQNEGKDISKHVLLTLKKYGYTTSNDMVYLQCFDPNELKRIRRELMPRLSMSLKLIQLIAQTDWKETFEKDDKGNLVNYDYNWMFESGAMQEIAKYANGIGPQYPMLIQPDSTKGNIHFTPMVKDAHANGLLVHPYTLRSDLLPDYVSNLNELLDIMYNQADVDGVFSDFPDIAVQYLHSSVPSSNQVETNANPSIVEEAEQAIIAPVLAAASSMNSTQVEAEPEKVTSTEANQNKTKNKASTTKSAKKKVTKQNENK